MGNEAYPKKDKFFFVPADQSSAEFGVEHTGLGAVGAAYLAGYFDLVVCWRLGLLGIVSFCGDAVCRLGSSLRKTKGSSKRK